MTKYTMRSNTKFTLIDDYVNHIIHTGWYNRISGRELLARVLCNWKVHHEVKGKFSRTVIRSPVLDKGKHERKMGVDRCLKLRC